MSEIHNDNEKYRFDSEFFQKKYMKSYALIKNKSFVQLSNIINILTDFHANGSYENIARYFELLDKPDYAYMIRSTDLEKSDFENDVKYVSEKCYNFLYKSKVYGGELLINKIGSPGKTYLMPTLNRPVSLGMNLFMVQIKKYSKIKNSFVWLFFNTILGKKIIERKINGTVPLTIDKEAIRSLPIPIMSEQWQKTLEIMIEKSEEFIKEAKLRYTAAQNLLLSGLGLVDYTPPKESVSVKSFADSFGASGRLDAEYYQPKYEEIINKISKFKYDTLGKLVSIKKSIEPGSEYYGDTGVSFVRVNNLSKFEISEPDIKIPLNTVSNISDLFPKKETILLSKDGSVGIAHKLTEDMNCVTSGAILHLNINNQAEILPDYLTLVLNSLIVQLQAERDAGGSIIQHWKPSEIKQVIIPIVDMDIQQQIADKVQQSFSLRKKSAELLDRAKQAVEMAIEQGEDVALKWLEGKESE